MHAVAEGRVRKAGIPKAVAKRLVAEDEGNKLPAKACNPCKPARKRRISSSLSAATMNQRKR